ncbi:hypothetical protein AVEN_95930-1, partial [Araneus ventricosus]
IKRPQSSWDDVINHQELLVYNRLFISFHLIAKAAVDPRFPDSNKRDFIENMREIKLNYIYLLPANFEIRHSIDPFFAINQASVMALWSDEAQRNGSSVTERLGGGTLFMIWRKEKLLYDVSFAERGEKRCRDDSGVPALD